MSLHHILAALLIFAYATWCFSIYRRYQQRRFVSASAQENASSIVVFASQSGFAQQLAEKTWQQLRMSGQNAALLPLNQLNVAALHSEQTVFFHVSTYGQGEAPDNGNRFLAHLQPYAQLSFSYAILALGNRQYPQFCGFARKIESALAERNATRLLQRIEVDKQDATAIAQWQQQLAQQFNALTFIPWQQKKARLWRLDSRQCLNPHSPHAKVFHLQLCYADEGAMPSWQAGDIVQIALCAEECVPDEDTLWREYSIASIKENNSLDILVRQRFDEQGQLGLGSSCLTQSLPVDSKVWLRIRENKTFHAVNDNRPMIFIGNGTGMAGLYAHLQQRITRNQTKNWLIFGERHQAHEFYFAQTLQSWLNTQQLTYCDAIFSRDVTEIQAKYVQDVVYQQAERLKQWLAEGAAIYVCGSVQGMAQALEQTLEQILGKQTLLTLSEQGLYRRDVY